MSKTGTPPNSPSTKAPPAKAGEGKDDKNAFDATDALLAEIEEDLRAEQFAKLWHDYGTYFLSVLVAVVALVAGHQYWEDSQLKQRREVAVQFENSVDLMLEEKHAEAAAAFSAIASAGHGGYETLARFNQATAYVGAKDLDAAAGVYAGIADDRNVSGPLRDLATVLYALRVLEGANEPVEEVERRLQPLTDAANPFSGVASELLAETRLQAGDTAEAISQLEGLKGDETAPASVRKRAELLLEALGSAAAPVEMPVSGDETSIDETSVDEVPADKAPESQNETP